MTTAINAVPTLRTWGRVLVLDKNKQPIIGSNGRPLKRWVEVTTDVNGDNTNVWITTLCQVLLLNLNESPFYGNYGIPGRQAVAQQLPPDFWVTLTQQTFAQYFASLVISRQTVPTPTYTVQIITKQGAMLNFKLGVPI